MNIPSISYNSGEKKWLAVTIVLTAIGLLLWGWQLFRGLYVTDMRDLSSWGIYIGMFTFFVGLSAGGLIIATVPRVFDLQGFKSISKIAVFLSICCTIIATALITVDLGRPERMWHLIAYSNFQSPLMWDVIVILTYLIVSIVYLVAYLRMERGQGSERALDVLSAVALGTAILVHSVTAWIFGLQMARPFWHTSIMAPVFIVSALVSGLALTLLVVLILQKLGYVDAEADGNARMAKLLGIFVLVELFFLFCESLTSYYPHGGTEYEAVRDMLTGSLAPMFWIEVIGALIAVYLLLNREKRQNANAVIVATVLVLTGAFVQKFEMLLAGFQFRNLTYPGVVTGPPASDAGSWWHAMKGSYFYFPTIIEWLIVLGLFALGALMVTLGLKYLPLIKPAK